MRATVANISGNDEEEDYASVSVLDRVNAPSWPGERARNRGWTVVRGGQAAAKKASRTREYKTRATRCNLCDSDETLRWQLRCIAPALCGASFAQHTCEAGTGHTDSARRLNRMNAGNDSASRSIFRHDVAVGNQRPLSVTRHIPVATTSIFSRGSYRILYVLGVSIGGFTRGLGIKLSGLGERWVIDSPISANGNRRLIRFQLYCAAISLSTVIESKISSQSRIFSRVGIIPCPLCQRYSAEIYIIGDTGRSGCCCWWWWCFCCWPINSIDWNCMRRWEGICCIANQLLVSVSQNVTLYPRYISRSLMRPSIWSGVSVVYI